MCEVIVVTSGKGGVGKTTTSGAIATGLAMLGKKTVVIDFDVGLRNLDLIMGCERRVVYDIIDVIRSDISVNQALIQDRHFPNLFILAASQTRDKDALTMSGVKEIINTLKQSFDYIICDSPAGIEKGAHAAMYFADKAIIVTNPEISSVRDSDRMIGLLSSRTLRAEQSKAAVKEYLLITRYNVDRASEGEMLSVRDILDILSIDMLGVIPESKEVLKASNEGVSVIRNTQAEAAQAYMDAVERLLGKNKPMRFVKRKGLIERLMCSFAGGD
ncbi:MAG: septum site-determining protein MinD [Pseudomonadota bacterium]|nr:septum site-determining protein MinD [Pseudomonadota bacterium]